MATLQAGDSTYPPLPPSAINGQRNHLQESTPLVKNSTAGSIEPTSSHLRDLSSSQGSHYTSTHTESEGELEGEDDILDASIEGGEVGKLLRSTVSELEAALQVDLGTRVRSRLG